MSLPHPTPGAPPPQSGGQGVRLLLTCALALALLNVTSAGLSRSTARADAAWPASLYKIDAADRAALLADILDGEAAFIVVLDRQADLRPASALAGNAAKGRFVYDALRAVAGATQPELIAALQARGAIVRSFIIVNALGVRGNLQALMTAAEFSHAARIIADTPFKVDLPRPDALSSPREAVVGPMSIEPGVNDVRAPAVWAMGYTGTGIVVGGQDTGVLWNHNALKTHYRGWNGSGANHDYNWHDAIHASNFNSCGVDQPAPCDDSGHGTHTVGTIVGDDGGGNQIGVAPGAQWIACRNMDEGFGRPSTYLECFEWFLAPYPAGGAIAAGDPDRAPHIISNSWGCPTYEGCVTGQEVISGVQAMRAAGILTVVSAGNHGPACSTVNDPPAIYAESFSVGAHSGGSIANFSSRGPVTLDGSGRMKPDIAAPGAGVRSAYLPSTNSYSFLQGTSMAAPHVAGAAALLWDAAPYLAGEVDLTEWVLRLNAAPMLQNQNCGGDTSSSHPNNVWGWGKLDALAVVSATFSLTPAASLAFSQPAADTFVLDASSSTDPESPAAMLLARWDFWNDGVWDTPWSLSKVYTGTLTTVGTRAAVQIADPGGRVDTAEITILQLDFKRFIPLLLKQES